MLLLKNMILIAHFLYLLSLPLSLSVCLSIYLSILNLSQYTVQLPLKAMANVTFRVIFVFNSYDLNVTPYP